MIAVFLAALAPAALFYVPSSLVLTLVGFPLVGIACIVRTLRSDTMSERVLSLAIPAVFLLVLGCLLLLAPRGGLHKRVGPLAFDGISMRVFLTRIEDATGYPTAAVNPATYTFLMDTELATVPPVTFHCQRSKLGSLLKEIEHQTGFHVVVRGASPFKVSLSGHYQTLDISLYIPR